MNDLISLVNEHILKKPKRKMILKCTGSLGMLLIARYIFNRFDRYIRSYPPGPVGLPFIGSLISATDLLGFSSSIRKTYNSPITLCYVGLMPTVFLHDLYTINQVIFKRNHIQRPDHKARFQANHISPNELSHFEISNEKLFKRKRKLFQSVLVSELDTASVNRAQNYSLNKVICPVIDAKLENSDNGEIVWYPRRHLTFSAQNILFSVFFGIILDSIDSTEYMKLAEMIDSFFKVWTFEALFEDLFYLLKYLPFVEKYNYYKQITDFMWSVYKKQGYDDKIFDINNKSNMEDMSLNVNKSDLLSKYIAAHRKNPGVDSTKNGILREIGGFVMGAGDTAIHSIEYILTLLAKYEDQQEIIYEELVDVFGDDILMEKKSLKDNIHKLHKFRAFIFEALRVGNIAALGAPYKTDKNIWIDIDNKKYCIPSGSMIFIDQKSAHFYDEYWIKVTNGNTKKVNMDIWLDDNGHFKRNKHKTQFMSFSMGQRQCPGQTLAMKSIYTFIGKFLLMYKLKLKDKNSKFKQILFITNKLEPQIPIILIKRTQDRNK